jgi:uncharacterized protein (UPF0335 family)
MTWPGGLPRLRANPKKENRCLMSAVLPVTGCARLSSASSALEEEKRALAGDIKEVYSEAKGTGFDTKIMRLVIKERRLDKDDRDEQETLLDVYRRALGMLVDTPLGEASLAKVTKRGAQKVRSAAKEFIDRSPTTRATRCRSRCPGMAASKSPMSAARKRSSLFRHERSPLKTLALGAALHRRTGEDRLAADDRRARKRNRMPCESRGFRNGSKTCFGS